MAASVDAARAGGSLKPEDVVKKLQNILFQKKIRLDDLIALKPCRLQHTDYYNIMVARHAFTVPGRTGSLIDIVKKSPHVPFALSHRCPRKWVIFYN